MHQLAIRFSVLNPFRPTFKWALIYSALPVWTQWLGGFHNF